VQNFYLKEFEILHKEVELMITALRQGEDRCLLITGGLWGWLLIAQRSRSIVVFLPSVLILFFQIPSDLVVKSQAVDSTEVI
jgi:hypothetical protein